MWERFKSGAVIVFVTLMIWFAADQNVKEEKNFRVSVRLVSSDPNRYASIAEVPHQAVFTVTLNARRRESRNSPKSPPKDASSKRRSAPPNRAAQSPSRSLPANCSVG